MRIWVRSTFRGISEFVYALLFATEGTGLLLRKHWAEYFTVVVTGSFMPFEIWELARHATVTRGAALVINALVVVYLIVRIHARKHGAHHGGSYAHA